MAAESPEKVPTLCPEDANHGDAQHIDVAGALFKLVGEGKLKFESRNIL